MIFLVLHFYPYYISPLCFIMHLFLKTFPVCQFSLAHWYCLQRWLTFYVQNAQIERDRESEGDGNREEELSLATVAISDTLIKRKQDPEKDGSLTENSSRVEVRFMSLIYFFEWFRSVLYAFGQWYITDGWAILNVFRLHCFSEIVIFFIFILFFLFFYFF